MQTPCQELHHEDRKGNLKSELAQMVYRLLFIWNKMDDGIAI